VLKNNALSLGSSFVDDERRKPKGIFIGYDLCFELSFAEEQ